MSNSLRKPMSEFPALGFPLHFMLYRGNLDCISNSACPIWWHGKTWKVWKPDEYFSLFAHHWIYVFPTHWIFPLPAVAEDILKKTIYIYTLYCMFTIYSCLINKHDGLNKLLHKPYLYIYLWQLENLPRKSVVIL